MDSIPTSGPPWSKNDKGVTVADDDCKIYADAQGAAKRQQNFDDLQNGLSGLANGRTPHFGVNKAQHTEAERKKAEATRTHLSALEQLLRDDPAYAELWHDVMDLLSEAERAADKALDQAKADLDAAQDDLEDIQSRANQLPDGTRIYKDVDGNVWTEDGRLVSQDELDGVVWKDGAPSYGDYLAGQEAIADAQKRVKSLEDYIYNILGPSRDKMTDTNNPPKPDDIKGIQDDILTKAPPWIELTAVNGIADMAMPTTGSDLAHDEGADPIAKAVDLPKL